MILWRGQIYSVSEGRRKRQGVTFTLLRSISRSDGEYDGYAGGVVFFSDSVREVLLVVLLHEEFVVHEENVGWHGDSGVAVVHYGSCVEELETLAVFFVRAWWFDGHCVLEQAVEHTSGDDIFRSTTDLGELAEYLTDVLTFLR